MRDRILEASIRVLRDQGALAFTTTRVADEAGISVGSLYQYFPNKHALVAALHSRDVRDGVVHIRSILDRPSGSPREKLLEIVLWFFITEAQEAATLGVATGDVEVFLRDGPDDPALAEQVAGAVQRFAELIDAGSTVERSRSERDHAVQFAMTTIESMGKAVAARRPPASVVERWARDTATMLADHLRLT